MSSKCRRRRHRHRHPHHHHRTTSLEYHLNPQSQQLTGGLHFKQHVDVGPEPLEDDAIPQNNNQFYVFLHVRKGGYGCVVVPHYLSSFGYV